MFRISARPLVLLAVPLLLLTAACGESGSDGDGEATEATEATEAEPFPGVTVSGELGTAPELEIAEPPFSIEETTTEVLIEGDGDTVEEGDQGVVQYLGVNGRTGEEFDSSWSRGGEPVTVPLEQGGLIQGFLDGLVGQTYGSRVALAIPPADGYGEAGNPQVGIEGDDTLVFVVDLLEAQPPPLSMAEGEEQALPKGLPELQTDADGIPTGFKADGDTESKVNKLVAAPAIVGEGPELEEGQTVTVHYVGQLYPDGKVFDESWSGGQPAQFVLEQGGLIQGFLDGLIGQPVGSRVVLAIPSELGYGKQGSGPIPADADLIFVVDILAAS
ncbi:MAG: FKBP-type peptidyl-prolyl cis-trans isomerase [Actinomycetota bacterium]|nr:FKBP-type peptidyl-prolyl cis-trans isomerase [Actinomycetota bacterium]